MGWISSPEWDKSPKYPILLCSRHFIGWIANCYGVGHPHTLFGISLILLLKSTMDPTNMHWSQRGHVACRRLQSYFQGARDSYAGSPNSVLSYPLSHVISQIWEAPLWPRKALLQESRNEFSQGLCQTFQTQRSIQFHPDNPRTRHCTYSAPCVTPVLEVSQGIVRFRYQWLTWT